MSKSWTAVCTKDSLGQQIATSGNFEGNDSPLLDSIKALNNTIVWMLVQ